MKKVLSVLLLLSITVLFAGCSNDLPDNPPSHGKITDMSYKSDYTGLSFTIPAGNDGWVFSTDEELAAGCGIDASAYSKSDFSEVLRTNKTVYDMMATSEAHHMSVIIGFENLSLAGEDHDMSAKDYVAKMIDRFSAGLTEDNPYTVSDTENVTLCGHTYARKILTLSGDNSWGEDYTLSQGYYARNLGGYMSITLVFFPGTVTVEQVESLFI